MWQGCYKYFALPQSTIRIDSFTMKYMKVTISLVILLSTATVGFARDVPQHESDHKPADDEPLLASHERSLQSE